MIVLLINYEYPPIGAGAANATRHIANALVQLGHKAVVLTAGFRGNVGHTTEDGGVDVYRLPSRRASVSQSNPREMMSFVWHAWRALGRVVRTHKPDAAFIFFSIPCGLLGPTLKGRYGIPYTILLRGGDVPGMEPHLNTVHTLLRPVRRRILRRARAVIANSKGLAEASMAADPIPVSVVPNGVDTNFFRPPAKRPAGPFTFLFVGRFQPQKNLPVVIDAFADTFAGTGVRLRLVGDGPQRFELEEQVARRSIASQVTFVPWLDKDGLLLEYQSAHCLINYSLYEGMPNVVLEAMACGLPTILSDIEMHCEVALDSNTVWFVQPDSGKALAQCLFDALGSVSHSQPIDCSAVPKAKQMNGWAKITASLTEHFHLEDTPC
jgi:glycosyltransferase involved in cell wall biosynthesis